MLLKKIGEKTLLAYSVYIYVYIYFFFTGKKKSGVIQIQRFFREFQLPFDFIGARSGDRNTVGFN